MLDKAFIARQKESLSDERARLANKIDELKKFPDYGSNEDDSAKEMADFESNLSLEEQLKVLVSKIDNALKEIESGKYGCCSSCGGEIEKGRLEIMPYAELCASCKKNQS